MRRMRGLEVRYHARPMELATRHGAWEDVGLPELPDVPGMTSDAECRYLYWLTREHAKGRGAVVEIGPWLGRSTIHLAAGMRDAGSQAILRSYDRFVWDAHQAGRGVLPLEIGESFKDHFLANVRGVYERSEAVEGDLADARWDSGPIEILFLDAPKNGRDLHRTFETFGPHLQSDGGLVVLQDYLFVLAPEIALVMADLSGCLTPVHSVSPGGTASFAVTGPVRVSAEQRERWEFTTWSAPSLEEAWTEALAWLPERPRRQLQPGLAALLLRAGHVDRACEVAVALDASGIGRGAWEKQARNVTHYWRYRPIFHALGLRNGDWDVLCDLEARSRRQAEERRDKVKQQRAELEQLRRELRELESGTWIGGIRSLARMGGRALRGRGGGRGSRRP